MKRIHLLPNVLTALGLTCGLFVIFKLNMTGVGAADEHVLKLAAAFLLLAGLFDLFDGAIARAMKVESEFGGLFDSLSDAVTFGVAPSVIILKSISAEPGTLYSFLITIGALVYSLCGVLRLVRFTASKKQDDLDFSVKASFIGLPIPAAASAAVSLDFLLISPKHQHWLDVSEETRTMILFAALVLIGYLMISRWKFPSVKPLQTKVGSFRALLIIVIAAVFIFYGLIYHFAIVFFVLSWGYLIISWILSMIRRIVGKKAAGLEDFEPEEWDGDDHS